MLIRWGRREMILKKDVDKGNSGIIKNSKNMWEYED